MDTPDLNEIELASRHSLGSGNNFESGWTTLFHIIHFPLYEGCVVNTNGIQWIFLFIQWPKNAIQYCIFIMLTRETSRMSSRRKRVIFMGCQSFYGAKLT